MLNSFREIDAVALLQGAWAESGEESMNYLILFCFLIPILFMDIKKQIITNRIILVILISGVVFSAVSGCNMIAGTGTAFGLGICLYSLGILKAGDVKLLAASGAFMRADEMFTLVFLSLIAMCVIGLSGRYKGSMPFTLPFFIAFIAMFPI